MLHKVGAHKRQNVRPYFIAIRLTNYSTIVMVYLMAVMVVAVMVCGRYGTGPFVAGRLCYAVRACDRFFARYKFVTYLRRHTREYNLTYRSTEFRLRFWRRMRTNGHFRRTFGFGRKHSYHIRCTFGFGVLQLVNSVVAEIKVQSLSCRCRECARRRESLASLPHCVLTDYV